MRIVAGKYGSRILKPVRDLELRPTSDRLRETLFNVIGDSVADARTLRLQQLTASVQLIEALGGGWDASQMPTSGDVNRGTADHPTSHP